MRLPRTAAPSADEAQADSIGLAVVGLGYWGPNLLRNAWEIDNARVASVFDRDEAALERVARRYPSLKTTQSFEDVISDDEVDAVVIATPVSTHYEMARQALEAGLLDEVGIDLVPVILGGGRPFFGSLSGAPYVLEGLIANVQGHRVTHLRYRVVRS